MVDRSVGELLAEARRNSGFSQKELAEALGFSTVLISKIEAGTRSPSAAFLDSLSRLLPKVAEEIQVLLEADSPPDNRRNRGPKIVEAIRLAKTNSVRAERLKSRSENLRKDADAKAQQLDEKARAFDREVLDPLVNVLSRVSGVPDDIVVQIDPQAPEEHPEFSKLLEAAQLRTSKSIASLIGAGLLGGGAGATIGTSAATATYITVASIAAASTGTAISSLSGAAGASATLAAIGGGSLAAGGLGVAGGTALLTTIVNGPVVAVAAGAVLASGGRVLDKQKAIECKLRQAEKSLDQNEKVVDTFVGRAGRINEILTVALFAARNHNRILERMLSEEGYADWSDIAPEAQASIRRLGEIALSCLTVLALPIGMNLKQEAQEGSLQVEVVGEAGLPEVARELDSGQVQENEFIDYAIERAFSQVAR